MRKGLKPSDWRYLGLHITPSPSTAPLPVMLPTYILSLVHTAQTSTLGVLGGAYNVDVLSTHASPSDGARTWHALLRVDATHAQDLGAALSMLPAPELGGVRLRIRIVGPTTAIQSVHSLLQ